MRITGGAARGVPLLAPKIGRLRPTSDKVRGAIFQVLGPRVAEATVLDLYAGTGALGIEALSRGAARADFVERDARLCQAIRQNLAATGFEGQGHVHRAPVEQAVGFLESQYDLVLLDPPYGLIEVPQVMEALGRPGLLAQGAVVVLEHSSRIAASEKYGKLQRNAQRRYGDTMVSLYVLAAEEDG